MDAQYNVELISMKITDISINIHVGNAQLHQMKTNFDVKVFEPSDNQNPTVMLSINGKMIDQADQIRIACSAEAVLKLDPIPTNWEEAVQENYKSCVQDVLVQKIQTILTDMGFRFHIA